MFSSWTVGILEVSTILWGLRSEVSVNVTVKLFANLQQYAPDGVKAAEPFEVEVPEAGTIEDLLGVLGIPKRETKVAFVNGRGRAHGYRLQADDEVGIFPPVGGG